MAVPYRRVGDAERQRDESRLRELERLRELISIRARMQEEPEQEEPQAPADFAAPRLPTPGPRQVKVNLKDIPGKVEKFIHEPPKGVDAESATKTFLNFFENAARTAGQFVEFPIDIAKQVQEAMLAPDAEEKLYKFAANNLKGIVDFTGQNIVDLVSAVHPLTSPEARKEAQDRIFGTGGLGPIAAISGLKHGIGQVPKITTTLKAGVEGFKGAPKAGEAAEVPPTAPAPTPAPAPKVQPRPRAARPEVPEEPKAIDEINAIRHAPDVTLRNETLQILGNERAGEIARMSRSNLEYYVSAGRTGVPYEPKAAAPPAEIDLKPREIEIVRDVAKDLGDVTEAAQERVLEEAVAAEAPKKIEAVAEAQTRKVRRKTVKDEKQEWVELFDLVQKRKATDAEVERFMELSKTRGAAAAKPEDANAGAVQKEETPPVAGEGLLVRNARWAAAEYEKRVQEKATAKSEFDNLVEQAEQTERPEPTEVDLYWNENRGRYEEVLNEIDDLADTMGDRLADPATLERGKRLADELAQIEEQATAVRTGERTAVLEPPPTVTEQPVKANTKVVDVPLEQIQTDVDRFQNRATAYAEKTATAIAERYDANKFDPVVLWKDQETGKSYVISGHSRLEGMARRNAESVPARYFEGTEEQAINFARIEANRTATGETFAESVKAYGAAKEQKYTKGKLKDLFGGDTDFLDAASHLSPGGKFIEILNQPAQSEFPYIKRTARWVGELRREIPQLTDAHERQLFDWLYQTTGKKGYENWRTPKEEFVSMVSRMTGDAFFDPRKPLIFKFDRLREAGMRGRSDAAETVAKIDKIKSQIKANIDLAKSGESLKRVLEINKDLEAELSRLETDLQTLEKAQPDMFGPNVQGFVDGMAGEISYFWSGFDMLDPFLSLKQEGRRNWDKFKKGAAVRMGIERAAEEQAKRGPKEPGLGQYIATPSNYMSAVPPDRPTLQRILKDALPSQIGDKPRFGRLAAAIEQELNHAEILQRIKIGERDSEFAKIIANIDDKDYGKMGETFVRLYQGTPIDDILADPKISERTKGAAVRMRDKFDEFRAIVVEDKRARRRPVVARQVAKAYRENHGLRGRRLGVADRKAIKLITESRLREMVPDNWGPDQYLPQIHPGHYRVTHKGKFVASAFDRFDAQTKIMELVDRDPSVKASDVAVEERRMFQADITRVTNAKRHAIVSGIARDAQVDRTAVENAVRGKIGAKEYRSKFFGSFQKRFGFKGYIEELPFILNYYNWGFTRWEYLSKLNRRVQPAIDALRRSGRTGTADYLQDNFEQGWGRVSTFSKAVDNSIQEIPYLRNHVSPFLLDRTAAATKNLIAWGYLKLSPGFHLRNNLQVFGQLWPIMGKGDSAAFREGLRAKGGGWLLTPEQSAILDEFGVRYVTGGKLLETRGSTGLGRRLRTGKKPTHYLQELRDVQSRAGVLAPEASNQEVAFLSMFQKGLDQGMDRQSAAKYAFLRGNLFTQFSFLQTDVPKALRGPGASTIFVFRRFNIKDIELGAQLLRDRRMPGFLKWVGARMLLSGARLPLKAAGIAGAGYLGVEVYRKLKDEFGKDAADVAMYGLPSLVGWDWSYSYGLIDMPYGDTPQESLGRLMMGIPGELATGWWTAARNLKGPYPTSAFERVLKTTSEKVPALRFIQAGYALSNKLASGEYDFRDPIGRTRYRSDAKKLLFYATGNKPLDYGIDALYLDWLTSVGSMYDRSLDKQVQEVMRANQEGRPVNLKEMNDWAALWPEFTYGTSEILTRYKARIGMRGQTQFERASEAFPKKFQYDERVRERAIGR